MPLSSVRWARCPVCLSNLDRLPIPHLEALRRCAGCGLVLDLSRLGPQTREPLVRHYTHVDPHQRVAASKLAFYRMVLQELDARVSRRPRRLLDVGCGYGHFIEMAAAAGWQVRGADIVPEAVRAARERVPAGQVFEGDLRQARLENGGFQAVTLWDVLDQLEDPVAALEECQRMLAPGGTIALRVRNATSQLWMHRCWRRIERLGRLTGLKPPSTFHRYSFTRRAVERILALKGFVDIAVCNSPLTKGDPYRHIPLRGALGMGKRVVECLAQCAHRLTRGRAVIGPSLLVWARKP